jgi:hypothetical protein
MVVVWIFSTSPLFTFDSSTLHRCLLAFAGVLYILLFTFTFSTSTSFAALRVPRYAAALRGMMRRHDLYIRPYLHHSTKAHMTGNELKSYSCQEITGLASGVLLLLLFFFLCKICILFFAGFRPASPLSSYDGVHFRGFGEV